MKFSYKFWFLILLFGAVSLSSCGAPRMNAYEISFETNGGSPVQTINTDGRSETNFPDDPVRDGFIFSGWFFDNTTFEIQFTPSYFIENPISKNITVFASWFPLSFTISFESNGGSYISPLTLNTDQNISFPSNPTKPGNSFGGWYIDNQFTTKFTSERMPPYNLTLYARWLTPYENFYLYLNLEEVDYTWDDEGPYKRHVISSRDGDDVQNESIYFYRDGAIEYFYYYRSGSLSNTGIIYEQTWRHSIKTHIDNIKAFTLSMDETRVTKRPNTPQTEVSYRSEAQNGKLLNISNYSASYTFNNNSWQYINHNDDPNQIIIDFYSNLIKVLPNVFTINQFTISFETNGGYLIARKTYDFGSKLNVPNTFKAGHSFDGWYLDAGLTQKFSYTTMPSYNLTLYAKWKINQYRITFETNGGSTIEPIIGNFGDNIKIPENPTKLESEFLGWFSNVNLTQPSTIPDTIPAANLTFYAKWSTNQYRITYETNGGSLISSQIFDFNSNINIPMASRLGHTFLGWFTDNQLTQSFSLSTMPNYDITLYAKWSINTYSINFVTNGGLPIETITGNYNDPINIPDNPFREEAIFGGWFLDLDLTQKAIIPNTIPALDLTLYAKWTINQYTITFQTNSEDTLEEQTHNFNETLVIPTPSKVGYSFEGWFIDNELSQVFSLTQMPPYNLTLYAKWSINQHIISYSILAIDKMVQISSGDSHTLALTTSGNVYSWGLNNFGQLGDSTNINRSVPTLVSFAGLESGERIDKVSAGGNYSFAVTTLGRVFAWGWNGNGQLGDGTTMNKSSPTLISFNGLEVGESIEKVNAGENHSLAVTTLGRVFAWGLNNYGQLGDGSTSQRNLPTLVRFSGLKIGEKIMNLSTGDSHSIAVTTDGSVFTWGWNGGGQLGDGTTTNRFNPQKVIFSGLQGDELIVDVTAGWANSHAITSNGRLFAWGWNGDGQLGDGTTNPKYNPILISFSGLQNGETIKSINTNFNGATIALTSNGRIYTWGFNGNGQLGYGSRVSSSTPTSITFPNLQNNERIKTFDLGSYHMIAITTSGRLYSSGFNGDGQLATGSAANLSITSPSLQDTVLISSFGTVDNYITLDYQQLIELSDPYLEGYVFQGWYMDEALTIPLNLILMGDEDLMLYAWFIPIPVN